ncbi:XRE family transcriptional regulator [Rathayibacter sp. AY1C9]|uniref:helix-turn-helix domain-containing protein n=1 Tax=Rathayibacter sp. AY1C9 TaxID=2080541 RepID=UPI000CE7F90B|nr:XRE family transcriptional regulator [Rathayibacter sp. AY1C9]
MPVGGRVPTFELHDRLRKAREEAGLSNAEMAEHLDLSVSALSHYQTGKAVPRRLIVILWALRTGVSHQWLQTGIAPGPDDDPDNEFTEFLSRLRESNPRPSHYE